MSSVASVTCSEPLISSRSRLLRAPAPEKKAPAAQQSGAGFAAKEAAALAAKKELEGKAGVQLGMTVKKEQAVFGDWYSQVSLTHLTRCQPAS